MAALCGVAASPKAGDDARVKTLGFHHVAVQVRDVQRVTDFYVNVLGLP
ncbi:MAG: VOC family protein, partial [Archangium sp.]